jgi:single-strand DNA-binding protein
LPCFAQQHKIVEKEVCDMSWDLNRVVIIGRLTKDPDLNYTQSGAAVCKFSIAVNRSSGSRKPRTSDGYQGAEGSDGTGQDDSTSFFNIVTWNKTAEICKEYLSKGRQVGIDGRLQQRRWTAEDGTKRSIVEIVANTVQFFGAGRATQEQYREPVQEAPQGGDFQDDASESEQNRYLSELDDDEIPF